VEEAVMSTTLTTAERDSNSIIERQLDERVDALENAWSADVLTYLGPMYQPSDDLIKDTLESRVGRRKAVAVVLETNGGYITIAERIAGIIRHHYKRVDFIVPTYAMSAGTVLVMAGDAIWMDYASTLGPIDPQVKNRSEQWVPALGYLEQYQRLIDKSANGTLTTAELAYLIQNFDPAELYQYEHERELSVALLEEWLVKYKFKNWKTTEGRGLKVNAKMRRDRAIEIARKLNDTNLWHSHGRGIAMEVLVRKVKLLIDDFGVDENRAGPLHDYFRLLQDYRMRLANYAFVIHAKGRYVGF
jgi:hypothetical protein